ncbi:unnamed protein product [Closterium sp. NIES-53]
MRALQVETLSNPKGLCEVSQSPNSFVMACPGKHRQQIRGDVFDQRRTHIITAHDSEPACAPSSFLLQARRAPTRDVLPLNILPCPLRSYLSLLSLFHPCNPTILHASRD